MSAPENPVQPREGRPPHIWQGERGRWCKGCQTGCRTDAQCACCDDWAKAVVKAIQDGMREEIEKQERNAEIIRRALRRGVEEGT